MARSGTPVAKRPVSLRNLIVLLACAGWLTATAVTPDAPRDRLRLIAQEQCLPHWLAAHDPTLCISVTLVADRLPGAKDAMGDFTLLVAGMEFKEGPGFVLLAGNSVPGAELMLDSSCGVAG